MSALYFESTDLSDTDPYWDGTGSGVAFSIGGNEKNNQGFPFTINHNLDVLANPPPSTLGVNTNQDSAGWLQHSGRCQSGDILEALETGDWNIGLHIIARLVESPEKYIATFLPNGPPQAPVPEPATFALLGMGVLFLTGRMRSKADKSQPCGIER